MAKRLKQRVGELIKTHGLTYSKFARKTGIGMNTARGLCENPYYNLTGATLYRSAEFFGVEPGELVVEEDEDNERELVAIAPAVKSPTESDFLFKFLELFLPQSMLEQVKKATPKGIAAFLYEAIAEKLEREKAAENSQQLTEPEFKSRKNGSKRR